MKKLIVGNWKMNGTRDEASALIAGIVNAIDSHPDVLERCEFAVCPPFLHLTRVSHALQTVQTVHLGAQDCAAAENGAFTGDVSASMLRDAGCRYVILGHSERRQYHAESDAYVRNKMLQAIKNALIPILCVGETEGERQRGIAEQVVEKQLADGLAWEMIQRGNVVIAYEPVWAIGTGKTPTTADVEAIHAFIRKNLQEHVEDSSQIRILYGGSMKPDNAADLLALQNVDGGLIGGASLSTESFLGIAQAA